MIFIEECASYSVESVDTFALPTVWEHKVQCCGSRSDGGADDDDDAAI